MMPVPAALTQPVWQGPCSDGPQGGITQGMIARWLCCRERLRLRVVDGLRAVDSFNHKIFYGDCFHACEEAWLKSPGTRQPDVSVFDDDPQAWVLALNDVVEDYSHQYPMDRGKINRFAHICMAQFPAYVRYWNRRPDAADRIPLLQEYAFRVPYKLPSGRTVHLRGKWDSVDVIGGGVWLTDHKTKGDLDDRAIARQLTFDLQTMTYLVTLYHADLEAIGLSERTMPTGGIRGVRYNCIRRPLAGGRHSIVQRKGGKSTLPEPDSEFYGRLYQEIASDPEYFFVRFEVEVTTDDIARFRRECLDPVLENVVDDFEWWQLCNEHRVDPFDGQTRVREFPHHCPRHFRTPYGWYNPITDGGEGDLDELMRSGSDAGLTRTTDLFPELAPRREVPSCQ